MTSAVTSPTPAAIVVVGECLVDLAPLPGPASGTAAPGTAGRGTGALSGAVQHLAAMAGGSPANVAVGLARLGACSKFAGRFSGQGFGPWLRDHLAGNGVELGLSLTATQPATLALVTFASGGRASYTFYGPETADWQWGYDELPGTAGPPLDELGVAAVHTGSLVAAFLPGAEALSRWLAALRAAGKVVVSFDPNVRPALADHVPGYRQRLEAMIASSHIVKASDEDIAALYPGADLEQAAERWLAAGPSLVVVTRGAEGATALHTSGARACSVPPPVTLADTIGAGDAFTAGLLSYFLDDGVLSPAGLAGLSPA
ncbi:MAG: carbohydrate kinase family protein, partial [Acidimicrobiales bacterium]